MGTYARKFGGGGEGEHFRLTNFFKSMSDHSPWPKLCYYVHIKNSWRVDIYFYLV